MDSSSNVEVRRAPASCVRFNGDEFSQIEEDSINTGKSIPALLKEKYFSGPRPLPLFVKADLERLFGELGRIGNNLNQVARRLNSGIRAGFVEELTGIQKSFDQLQGFLSSKYCRCSSAQRQ